MKHPHVATAEIVSYVEDMIAIPKALAFPDKPALYVLQDLILKGRKQYYLSHPEFLEGFRLGYKCGFEELQDYDLDQFTFGSVVHEVEIMLSHARHADDLYMAKRLGWRCVHHSYNVGAAFGWLSALFESDFALRLPRTLAELQRRLVSSPITSGRVSVLQEEIA